MDKNLTLKKVARFISKEKLLKQEGKYIVALSGGADSIALTLMMKSLGYDISAAHCNFRLRGEESDRDEQFCIDFCEREGIHLHRIHFDTQSYAQMHKKSIEMAARELRYCYFAQLAVAIEADGILVAHHRDDNVETLLLNLLRGSGVDGLAAIAPKNDNIIRPLLCISREEILQYLKEINQDYVTDSTNLEDDALRNKIRHHVIPLLETINPAARENIALSAKYLRQAAKVLNALPEVQETSLYNSGRDEGMTQGEEMTHGDKSKQKLGDRFKQVDSVHQVVYFQKKVISQSSSPQFLLHKAIGCFGFHGNVIDEILESFDQVGKMWKSTRYLLVIDREQLIVTPQDVMDSLREEREFRFPEEGNYHIGEIQLSISRYLRSADFKPSKDSHRITLDADKVSFPLTYRLTKEGDRFRPFGMKGSKLVSDYLTDRKQNYLQKATQHVMTDHEGKIIWLVGERTSENCKITDETREILEIKIEKDKK